MEKLYVNKLNDSKYVALITVLDYEISVNKYLKQLSFEASSNKPEHVLVDLALKTEYSANRRPLVTVEKSTQYAGQVHLTKKLNTVGSPQLI